MKPRNLVLFAVSIGLAVAVLPWLIPTGPDAGLDATRFLQTGSFAAGAAVVFAGGLLTALTPCVYPLIPITVSVFGARKADSRLRSVVLTSAYVVGMGIVFAALGVLAAKTGQAFGSLLGHPAVVGGLALFMLLLAASMFGAFELALPSGLAQRLNAVGGSGVGGAFLMGSVSGFLAAPCTGPVLTGLLTFVATSQSTALGASLLFIYALGIGVPFFILGVSTLQLPKGGAWMDSVKSVLGIVLVALAATYIRDAWPWGRTTSATLAAQLGAAPGAWIAGAVAAGGVLLGAVHLSFKTSRREFAAKALAVAVVVAALLVRTAALNAPPVGHAWVALGWAEPSKAPKLQWHLRFPSTADARPDPAEFEKVLAQARSEGRPVMVDFFAEWCAACKELDRETFVSADVIHHMERQRFLNIKVDATNEPDEVLALFERFGVEGLPTVAFVSPDGQIMEAPRVTGFVEPEKFVEVLRGVR